MDENRFIDRNIQSNILKMSPAWGIVWTLILTPIAGGVFWAVNWSRLGYPKNRWWTVLSGIIITLLGIYLNNVFNLWAEVLIEYIWMAFVFVMQKRVTPGGVKSVAAWITSVILLVIMTGYDVYIMWIR